MTSIRLDIQNLWDNEEDLTLKEIVISLGIDDAKEHLSKDLFLKLAVLYAREVKNIDDIISRQSKIYDEILLRYPNVADWETAPSKEKILNSSFHGDRTLYYFTLVFCKRIKADWNILNSRFKVPSILTKAERQILIGVSKELNYAEITYNNLIYLIEKIMICSNKKLCEINEADIYQYRNFSIKPWFAKSAFQVLKRIGNISSEKVYETNGKENLHIPFAFELKNQNPRILNAFSSFKMDVVKENRYSTSKKSISAATQFVGWLWDYHQEITKFNMMEFTVLKEFSAWLKVYKSPKTQKPYSKKTIVTILSSLKHFMDFLYRNNQLNENITKNLALFNELYLKNYKGNVFPEMVPAKDRRKIEEIIYGYENKLNPMAPKMLKIKYLLGLRPSELRSLAVGCLKGPKETPHLHVHRGKRYTERYIPLIPEVYEMIEELEQINKSSPPIYDSYDGLTVQRLFAYRGEVIAKDSLNDIFKALLVKNGVVKSNNSAKYTLYILRKIRISTWLEAGLSEDEVAVLAGHNDVNSHNAYIISKEWRLKNAKLIYNKYYKEFMGSLIRNKCYIKKDSESKKNETENYLQRIQDIIMQVEKRNINQAALEPIVRNNPHLLFPVPCGICFAMAVFDGDFQCERMSFPCLECNELLDAENHIIDFDNYVKRLFESNYSYIKSGINGLLHRNLALIDRLKRFYTVKFTMDETQVNERFIQLDNEVNPSKKRGRKKAQN